MHMNVLLVARNDILEPVPMIDSERNTILKEIEDIIKDKNISDIHKEFLISDRKFKLNDLFRSVIQATDDWFDHFSFEPNNSDYLEFQDMTDDVKRLYNENYITLLKCPNGAYKGLYSMYTTMMVSNGKVYERNAGKCHVPMRTKKARKYSVVTIPVKRAMSLDDYADYIGYSYDENNKKYGYYSNPDGAYDYISIGGRWENAFLVKDTVEDYIPSMSNDTNKDVSPKGYKWAIGARKKDIEWDEMLKYYKAASKNTFNDLIQYFDKDSDSIPNKSIQIKDDVLTVYGTDTLHRGDSYEDYIKRNSIKFFKYNALFHSMINDDEYTEFYNISIVDDDYEKEFVELIDGLDDDDVLVSCDAHY